MIQSRLEKITTAALPSMVAILLGGVLLAGCTDDASPSQDRTSQAPTSDGAQEPAPGGCGIEANLPAGAVLQIEDVRGAEAANWGHSTRYLKLEPPGCSGTSPLPSLESAECKQFPGLLGFLPDS